MDQLFINERELPPTPSASAQSLDSARNPEGLSVRQGKSAEAPLVSARGEETLQLWLGNEYTRERQRLEQEERAAREGYEPPIYTEAEISAQRSGSSQQAANPQAASIERSSRVQDSLEISTGQSQSTLDIYDNNSERGVSRDPSPSLDISAGSSDASNRPIIPRRYSRPSRPYSGYPGNANRESPTPSENAGRPSGSLPSQVFRGPLPQTEVVVPRWQPDAEVTFCPICRTQFSWSSLPSTLGVYLLIIIGFFVRKHHCR